MTTAYRNTDSSITLKLTPKSYQILKEEPAEFITEKNKGLVKKILDNGGTIDMQEYNREISDLFQDVESKCHQYLQNIESNKYPQSNLARSLGELGFAVSECYQLTKEVISEIILGTKGNK
ncbi:MAG: hypothetical protein VXZ40_03685 [Nanoarchaeota archaeon]|nr:hypothetical protein [Nanoarchaeota archaeon]